jgi:hypothetical protein
MEGGTSSGGAPGGRSSLGLLPGQGPEMGMGAGGHVACIESSERPALPVGFILTDERYGGGTNRDRA